MASMAFFCVGLAEAPRQLLRIGTPLPKANREMRAPVFRGGPNGTFFARILFNFLFNKLIQNHKTTQKQQEST